MTNTTRTASRNASRALRFLAAFAAVGALALSLGACASSPPPEAAQPIALDAPALMLDGERYLGDEDTLRL